MRKSLAILCLAAFCSLAFAGTVPAVTKAYVDKKGWVRIVTADGRHHTVQTKKWQAGSGYEAIEVAPDGKTVGWLADQMLTHLEGSTNYSYAVALELDIWRNGKVIRRFPADAYLIQDWIFLKNGDQVAFHMAPPHGQDFCYSALYDVNTGKKLDHWAIERKDYVVPDWAKQLVNDDLPGPEISDWFPTSPTPTTTAKPQK